MTKQPQRPTGQTGKNRSGNPQHRNPQQRGSQQRRPSSSHAQEYSPERGHGQSQHHRSGSSVNNVARIAKAKKRRRKKVILFVVEILVLLLLLGGLFIMSKLGRIDRQGIKIGDLEINELDSETKEILSGYTTIALFGIDTHDAGDFQNGRTDTIIVASINNDTKEVKMCSVYRDTYLNVGDGVYAKCNAAYQKGGPQQAISMLDNNMDLDITDYITVDFNAMVDIIDDLGGITLTITQEELEAMVGMKRVGTDANGEPVYEESENYIKSVAEASGQEPYYNLVAGTQNCSGVTAVAYCRVRYTAGDDYRRSERQREVITQIIQKAKASDLTTVNKVINHVFDEISTSYSNMQLLSLASNLMDYSLVDSAGFPFYKNTKSVGQLGSCVIPCDLTSNVDYMHHFLFGDEAYEPTDTVIGISKEITNKTGYTRDDADDRLYGSVQTPQPAAE